MPFSVFLSGLAERIFAGRWIAGPTAKHAMRRTRELNELGKSAIINCMGEEFIDKRDIAEAMAINLQLVKAISKNKLDASISLKITQLGLRASKKLATRNYGKIVSAARKSGIFVWLDAEKEDTIEDAIRIYESQMKRGGVGIAVQAYLKRSEKNMERLRRRKAIVRLVKGAYKESKSIAFQSREEVEENFLKLMRILFKDFREFTIATHDSDLIDEAMELNRVYRRKVTYAMLNGIRNNYATRLAENGNRVAIYVPFGTRWIEYSLRRLSEMEHVVLVARSLLGG